MITRRGMHGGGDALRLLSSLGLGSPSPFWGERPCVVFCRVQCHRALRISSRTERTIMTSKTHNAVETDMNQQGDACDLTKTPIYGFMRRALTYQEKLA